MDSTILFPSSKTSVVPPSPTVSTTDLPFRRGKIFAGPPEALRLVVEGGDPSLVHPTFSGRVVDEHGSTKRFSGSRTATASAFTTNDALVPAVADMVQQSGAYVAATLSTFESIAEITLANLNGQSAADLSLGHEGVPFLTNSRINGWHAVYASTYSQGVNLFPRLEFQKRFLKAFHDEGLPLLLGTDSPVIPGLVPGYSTLRELELFVEAGLTPAEALHAGTANAEDFISASIAGETPFGRVVEGNRADLLLLRENPLLDVRNVRALAGVMARGRWYSEEWIAETRASLPIQ